MRSRKPEADCPDVVAGLRACAPPYDNPMVPSLLRVGRGMGDPKRLRAPGNPVRGSHGRINLDPRCDYADAHPAGSSTICARRRYFWPGSIRILVGGPALWDVPTGRSTRRSPAKSRSNKWKFTMTHDLLCASMMPTALAVAWMSSLGWLALYFAGAVAGDPEGNKIQNPKSECLNLFAASAFGTVITLPLTLIWGMVIEARLIGSNHGESMPKWILIFCWLIGVCSLLFYSAAPFLGYRSGRRDTIDRDKRRRVARLEALADKIISADNLRCAPYPGTEMCNELWLPDGTSHLVPLKDTLDFIEQHPNALGKPPNSAE